MIGHIPPVFSVSFGEWIIDVGEVVLQSAQLNQAKENQEEGENGDLDNGDPEHIAEYLHCEEHQDANNDDKCVNDHGDHAEDSDGLSVVFQHPPVSFEDAKGVKTRVVGLVALECAEECESCDAASTTAVFLYMLAPPVVCWIVVLLQLEFRNLASLIEHPLLFGNEGSVECAAVEALENEIEQKQDSNQNTGSQEQQPFVVVESPE